MSYHAVEVGDSGVLVGVGVKQHLGVGVDGYVCLDTFPVPAQELGDGLDFGFRLREGTTVGVIAGVRGGALIWGRERRRKGVMQQNLIEFYTKNRKKKKKK